MYQILGTFCRVQLFTRTWGWRSTASAWPPISTCVKFGSSLWSLVLRGCDIPFWKAFDKPNVHVRLDFWFPKLYPRKHLENYPKVPWSGSIRQFSTFYTLWVCQFISCWNDKADNEALHPWIHILQDSATLLPIFYWKTKRCESNIYFLQNSGTETVKCEPMNRSTAKWDSRTKKVSLYRI